MTYPKGDPGELRLTRDDLTVVHREGVDAAEAAQRNHGWTKGPSRDRHPHLVLPSVTFIPTFLEDYQATGSTTITSRIATFFFLNSVLGVIAACSMLGESDKRKPVGVFALSLLGLAVGLLIGRKIDRSDAKKRKKRIVQKHGTYLFDDGLLLRDGAEADSFRFFPRELIRGTSPTRGGHVGTKLDYRDDEGAPQSLTLCQSDIKNIVDAWLARRAKPPA